MKLKAVTPLAGVGTQITDAVGFLQLEQKPFEKSEMHRVVAKTLYGDTLDRYSPKLGGAPQMHRELGRNPNFAWGFFRWLGFFWVFLLVFFKIQI